MKNQKIVTFLWFNNNAEEAVSFYVSLFPESKVLSMTRYPEGSPGPTGQVMSATFELSGQQFYALNGGPMFKFTEAISLFVKCETQEEVDTLWNKLLEGGEEQMCGWLKDKFGLSWQIIPDVLSEYLSGKDPAATQRAMQAMLQMRKIDIEKLKKAYEGR